MSLWSVAQWAYTLLGSWNTIGMRVKAKLFPSPENVYPDRRTDIVIESFGGSASKSFVAYVQKANPDLRIATDVGNVGPMRYALRHGIPVVYVYREPIAAISSVLGRYSRYTSMAICAIRYMSNLYYVMRHSILVLVMSEVMKDPAGCVRSINTRHGLVLDEGDGLLPKIRTEQEGGYERG